MTKPESETPYSVEVMHTAKGTHYRVRNAADNRIATCYLRENADKVVAALNAALAQNSGREVAEALKELVRLKDLKDAFGKCAEYERMQPQAWERARELAASLPSAPAGKGGE